MFRNDPVVDELPRFGAGAPVLLAERTRCGEAFVWEPGADAQALVDFVGERFVLVAGEVYERWGDVLRLVGWLKERRVVVKPPAGDVLFLSPGEVATQWASVSVWEVAPVENPSAAELNERFVLVDGLVPPSTDAGVPPIAPADAGAGDGEQAAPEVVAASPAPARRGRPPGSKNRPKEGE